jgi:D-sedoheptulose 7-phosphate isomerase
MKENIRNSCSIAVQAITGFFRNEYNVARIVQASQLIATCFKNSNKVLICGNGGSACDAMHFAEEFTGRFRKDRKALPVISLTDSSHITCVGNDYGFEEIFARGVEAYGKSGDILVGISTSGNSENVIKAIDKAKKLGMQVISLLGKDGGKLAGIADLEFIVNAETTDRIQEVHMTVLHLVIEGVERLLFPNNY